MSSLRAGEFVVLLSDRPCGVSARRPDGWPLAWRGVPCVARASGQVRKLVRGYTASDMRTWGARALTPTPCATRLRPRAAERSPRTGLEAGWFAGLSRPPAAVRQVGGEALESRLGRRRAAQRCEVAARSAVGRACLSPQGEFAHPPRAASRAGHPDQRSGRRPRSESGALPPACCALSLHNDPTTTSC
jgi:hypothetical protein